MRNIGPINKMVAAQYSSNNGVSYTVWGSYNSNTFQVSSSAVIKGNKKTPNPWSYTINDSDNKYIGTWRDRNGSYGGPIGAIRWIWKGSMQGLPLPVIDAARKTTLTTNAYNTALDRLNDKVRGGLDLSVAMAESSSTLRMVRALTKTKRYFSGIGSKRWANEWLELKYGWQPLLSDIYGAANEIINVNLGLMTFKGRGSDSVNTSGTRTVAAGGADLPGYTNNPIVLKQKISTFCACELQVTLKAPTSVQQAARWSSLNPVSIAWELVPYSFVVDWFYDIGGYLRNAETQILYNSAFVSGYRSELSVEQGAGEFTYNDSSNTYFTKVVYAQGTCKVYKKSFNRTVLTSYPFPRRPRINTDLSSNRLLSAAALLRQLIK